MICSTCGVDDPEAAIWDLSLLLPLAAMLIRGQLSGWNPIKVLCRECTRCGICGRRVAPGDGPPRLLRTVFAAHYDCIDAMGDSFQGAGKS